MALIVLEVHVRGTDSVSILQPKGKENRSKGKEKKDERRGGWRVKEKVLREARW